MKLTKNLSRQIITEGEKTGLVCTEYFLTLFCIKIIIIIQSAKKRCKCTVTKQLYLLTFYNSMFSHTYILYTFFLKKTGNYLSC